MLDISNICILSHIFSAVKADQLFYFLQKRKVMRARNVSTKVAFIEKLNNVSLRFKRTGLHSVSRHYRLKTD